MILDYLRGLGGIVALIGIAYSFSNYKKDINWRLVFSGIVLQLIIAITVLKVNFVRESFEFIGGGLVKFLSFALNGAEFLFGDLAKKQ